jgi:pre-mRNA-splicing factor ATP-dependent RNA helicase DHX38/PRP16
MKTLEGGGTTLGNVLGVPTMTEEEKQAQLKDKGMESEVDYKKGSQFSSHLKDKSDAVSSFARTKSIREQREFLPVFTVRNELLKVVRDHQIIIVVGETGSGKTTQLTQVSSHFGLNRIMIVKFGICDSICMKTDTQTMVWLDARSPVVSLQ